MRNLKKLLVPAALAFAPALVALPATAAPMAPGGAAATTETGIETTPVWHRGYYHEYYYYGPYYRHHRHRYYYGPRCHWSSYWHRTVCRY